VRRRRVCGRLGPGASNTGVDPRNWCDEIQYAKGHKYLTLVYQIDQGSPAALGWQGTHHRILPGFFTIIREQLAAQIDFVCSDMWQPYLDVIRQKCSRALHILDRFHIVAEMNKALDEVRAAESRQMGPGRPPAATEEVALVLLKRKENLTSQQKFRLRELLRYNLQTVRAYLLKEDFQQLWEYNSPTWAALFLDFWCYQTMRSRIEPMKKIARTLRTHRELLLNYFKARKQISTVWSRAEQQSQSNHEKILRLSHFPHPGTRALSFTWQIT